MDSVGIFKGRLCGLGAIVALGVVAVVMSFGASAADAAKRSKKVIIEEPVVFADTKTKRLSVVTQLGIPSWKATSAGVAAAKRNRTARLRHKVRICVKLPSSGKRAQAAHHRKCFKVQNKVFKVHPDTKKRSTLQYRIPLSRALTQQILNAAKKAGGNPPNVNVDQHTIFYPPPPIPPIHRHKAHHVSIWGLIKDLLEGIGVTVVKGPKTKIAAGDTGSSSVDCSPGHLLFGFPNLRGTLQLFWMQAFLPANNTYVAAIEKLAPVLLITAGDLQKLVKAVLAAAHAIEKKEWTEVALDVMTVLKDAGIVIEDTSGIVYDWPKQMTITIDNETPIPGTIQAEGVCADLK